ncbi:dihydrolipoyllysine acetyltransferase, partial [Gammaproteobacteria bacterium]|nr:dihydrolipoyllysine acetyltransferase [Gammaproteobacteria bacterium]
MQDLNLNIPDLGDVEEVEVIEICVEVGQSVEAEDSIIILETDKAAMEIPTTKSGIVKDILVDVGDMVQEGTPFVQIEFEEDKKSNIEETNKTKTQIEEIQIPAEKEDIDINENEIVLVKPLIPDLGDVEEVEVIEICVEVGQNIGINDSIMILETDKAAMEIPASVEGKVTKLNISLGDMVKAGMP